MIDFILKALPVIWQKGKSHVQRIWISLRLPSLQKSIPSEDVLRNSAFTVLGGSIERVIAYRDISDGRTRMVVSRRPFDQSYEWQISLLEQFGSSFRAIWDNPQRWWVSDPSRIRVADLDGDGIHEIYAVSASYGTGAGSENLHCFVPARNAYYNISWEVSWQSWDSTPVPKIVADFDNRAVLKILEKVAEDFGLCRPDPEINLNEARNAVLRWRKENGNTTSGRIRIHRYAGSPVYPMEAPDVITLQDGLPGFAQQDIELCRVVVKDWIFVGHFKGAVFAFDRRTSEHFVLWSPPSMYDWPAALLYASGKLYIGSRGQGLLRYDVNTSLLVHCKKFGEIDISEIGAFRLVEDSDTLLEVGTPKQTVRIAISYLDDLERPVAMMARVRTADR